ncbi:TlpA disulfide reductase family protein [uncultured Maritimibacter sp.]|uniref:TlpA family protein disulfide reductase n=1 Tax=uncultured Maritimibacter sp. TaxID=991866 RepID=UPI0026091004|nr:TlpA disulfide reductase family protein [uncultured Maritimibacter sp.]
MARTWENWMNYRTALYAALLMGANAVFGSSALADTASLEALREGSLTKLMFHGDPKPVSEAVFTDEAGGEVSLADYRGKVVVLNFWATWCAPCRHEMPMLDALQAEFGGDDFAVVTVATGRNKPMAVEKFFDEVGVTNLPKLYDPKKALAAEMGVMGLPVTVLLDRNGNEVARMMGDADWSSESAKAIVAAMIAEPAS